MSVTFNPNKPVKAEYWDEPLYPGTIGSGHSISSDAPEENKIDQPHNIIEEVTRKPVMRYKQKIGFM